jgi:hypothetical protein
MVAKVSRGVSFTSPTFVPSRGPVPPLPGSVCRTSTPFELVNPQLVCDPITFPIIGSSVDQHTHAAVQEIRDVILRVDGPSIHVHVEALTNGGGTMGEVVRRFYAKELMDLGEVQVRFYEVGLFKNSGGCLYIAIFIGQQWLKD